MCFHESITVSIEFGVHSIDSNQMCYAVAKASLVSILFVTVQINVQYICAYYGYLYWLLY